MNTQDVHLVFTASPRTFSRLIRWFTNSPTSHVMVEYPSDLWGGRWIAQASVGGVHKVPANKARHYVVADVECVFDVRNALHSIAQCIGNPYDYEGLAGYTWSKILKKYFRRKMSRPLHDPNALFCSEMVATMLIAAKLPGTEDWTPEFIAPVDILRYCLQHPELFKVMVAESSVEKFLMTI